MDKGKYFEWICLGGGAIGPGDDVTDLPRTNTGKKTIEQIRIEEQAARFSRLFDPDSPEFLGFIIIDKQVEIYDPNNNSKGTIDFVVRDVTDSSTMIIDLKLTKDATSTRSEYGWGNSWSELDMLQLIHYRDLYYVHSRVLPRTALLVFDYSPDKVIKFGEILISEKARRKKDIRIATGWDVIDLYNKNGWITIPSKYECAACPLNCPDRNKENVIERFTINI